MSTIKTIHQDKLQSLSNIIIKLENTDVTKVVHKTVSCELSDEGHSILSKVLKPVTKDETNVIIKADKESSCVIVHKEPCKIKIKEVLYTEIKLTEPDYNLAKTSISRRVVLFYQPRILKYLMTLLEIGRTIPNSSVKHLFTLAKLIQQ
ncbi:unnamed protein product [Rotaria sp. Silwood1]|nr:unnamed protein product [Rotaria sp. Silwood1]CAF4924581.1 unnamed protein product [Rotaria sp. Silwood1]